MQMLPPSSLSHPSRAQFQFGSILIFEQNWSRRNSAASFLLLGSGHHWHHFWPGGSQSRGSSTPWGKNRWRSCFYWKHWVRSATNKPRWQVRMPEAPFAAAFHLHRRDISRHPSLFILNSPLLSFLNIWNWVLTEAHERQWAILGAGLRPCLGTTESLSRRQHYRLRH